MSDVILNEGQASAVELKTLRCEYLAEPLGVDTPLPRFSWQLDDPAQSRGRSQSAYHVQVQRLGAGGREILWDSGKVGSGQSVNVAYAGMPLRSAWDCRWRVRVWDESGNASGWSEEARFVMGLLDPSEWNGEWIRASASEAHQHLWFRKTFELGAVPAQALAYLCSIGYHELYVNGKRIGDAVLTPGVTNLTRRALYMTYDIRKDLRPGRNAIALWTGPGWARADGSYGKGVWKQTPMLKGQFHLGNTVIATDSTWRWAVSSSENIGLWKGGGQGTYGGERIDARRYMADWNTVAFDDSRWTPASIGSQSIEASSALFEPDRRIETLRPFAIEQRDGAWRIDFGRNFTGWFEIDLHGGREGDLVQIHTSNRLEVTIDYDQCSEYIFDASGEGTFSHRFNWMAGRWVTLYGLCTAPAVEDIRGYVVTNDRRRFGRFECSNGLLNAIYETDLRTYLANTVNGAVMDCPHRERYGYGEIALACTWGCAIPNFDSAALYAKMARDWCDVQYESGMINTIAPQPYEGAGGTLWSSAPVTLTWEHYRAYGDKRLLGSVYPTVKRWLQYLHEAVNEAGVLMPYARDSRFLGDWATPHGNEYGNIPEARLFNNCVYAYDLMVATKMAQALGHADDALLYEQRLTSLRRNVHRYFYNGETGRYGDGRQMAMLFPLYVRITPEHLRETVFGGFMADLAIKGYLDTGSPGLPILLKAVVEDMGKPEILFPALTRTAYPSYGFFLARQESTWPEYWQVDGIKSRIHTCYTGVAGYMIRGMGGIQANPADPGMRHVLIRPYFPDSLSYCRTTTATLYGPIVSNWKREDGAMHLQIIIPPNASATVCLPVASPSDVTESGVLLGSAMGVTVVTDGGEALEIRIESGCYLFQWTVPAQPEAE